MGYFVAIMGCCVIDACFCTVHSIIPINMCTDFDINWYKIVDFRKRA